MKVGLIGSGIVAQTLAAGFARHGHGTMLGTRNAARLAGWRKAHPSTELGTFADAARFGDIVVLSVKGSAALDALRAAGAGNLSGKPVIDTTNPIADVPPVNGLLRFFTSLDESLLERLQREFDGVRFVKAFNSVGAARMVNPHYKEGMPTMFICGNDAAAKKTVLICPVSGDKIASAKAAKGHSAYKGKTYYFCCSECKPRFDKAPASSPQRCPLMRISQKV